MPRHSLAGTDLDAIFQSERRQPAVRVELFDPYQDSFSDMVLDQYEQVPLDITQYVKSVNFTQSVDLDASQATFEIAPSRLSYRLFMWSWVKVFYGDYRVDPNLWPCVFTGVFQGQPGRQESRGNLYSYSHTAYGRCVYFRTKNVTSTRVWNPTDADANIGEIASALAQDDEYGMALQQEEVLFNKFFRPAGVTTGTGSGAIVGGSEWRVNKKLQVVDIPILEALTNLLQVVKHTPGFNGEGKLVAWPLTMDRPPTRIYADNNLVKSLDIPQNTYQLTTSVLVRGLDYRVTRVEHLRQKVFTVGPVTMGFFAPSFLIKKAYDEEEKMGVEPDSKAQNVKFEGGLFSLIFTWAPGWDIDISKDGEFRCRISVEMEGLFVAYVIVTALVLVYIELKILAAQAGSSIAELGWAWDLSATTVLLVVLQALRSLGTLTFEVWGVPYEYVYREIEAKALLSDVTLQEEQEEEVENHILGTLYDCKDLARFLLQRKAAMIANRTIQIMPDFLLEPGDIIEVLEEGNLAAYYIQSIETSISRGQNPTMNLSVFRVR